MGCLPDIRSSQVIEREHSDFYILRQADILADFERAARRWRTVLAQRYGDQPADEILCAAREELAALLPQLPYIGGDENHLTGSLIGSAQCLALYRAMAARGRSAAEAGRVLYDANLAHAEDHVPHIPPEQRLSHDELMRRRRERAERSQERRYAWDWVYEFIAGDGETFDYGYDYLECATEKFYRAQGALAFLPFYCFLDFPKCELAGLGLSRATTLGEGGERCDFRFVEGGRSMRGWPPPFLPEERAHD